MTEGVITEAMIERCADAIHDCETTECHDLARVCLESSGLAAEVERLTRHRDQLLMVHRDLGKAQKALCPQFDDCADGLAEGEKCACGFEDGPYGNAVPPNRRADELAARIAELERAASGLAKALRKLRNKILRNGMPFGIWLADSIDAALAKSALTDLADPSSAREGRWQPIETAPLAVLVLLWSPAWRHPFPGRRNGDCGRCWVDTCEPNAAGWQTFCTHWMQMPNLPDARIAELSATPSIKGE